MSLGHWAEADRAFERALSLFQQINDQVETARALNNLSRLYRERGEGQKALQYLQAALTEFQRLGDEYSQASVLNNLGALHCWRQWCLAAERMKCSWLIRSVHWSEAGAHLK
jgi:tetratricopeptide (TPR) repeat protein